MKLATSIAWSGRATFKIAAIRRNREGLDRGTAGRVVTRPAQILCFRPANKVNQDQTDLEP